MSTGRRRGWLITERGGPGGQRPEGGATSATAEDGERPPLGPVRPPADDHAAAAPVESLVRQGGQWSAYQGLLRNRNYRLYFVGALSSSIGDWAGLFALQTLVTSLYEQSSRLALFSLGAIMMARLLPSLLFGPVAGVLADRYDRKRLMVGTDVLRGGAFLFIAFSTDVVALFALTFFVECLSLLFISSKDAVLPSLVDRRHLKEANQLNLLVAYGTLPLGGVLGSTLAGLAILLGNMGLGGIDPIVFTLLINAATFLLSGLLVSRLRLEAESRRAERREPQSAVDELREGLRFIQGLPVIRALILGVVGISFGAGVVVTLGPEFVRSTLGRPSTDWQIMITAVGAGLVAGIVAVTFLPDKLPKERVFPVGLTLTAVIAIVLATLSSFPVVLVFGFLLGAVSGVSFVLGYTLLMEYTSDDIRGKTFAAFYTGTRVSLFAALGLAPFLAGAIGVFTIGGGGLEWRMSGVRVVVIFGGLVGLFSALSAGRAMWRGADSAPAQRRVKLPGAGSEPDPGSGLFIAFEGVEGSGKSTQVRALVQTLADEGHDVVVTREPGGPPVAERIRNVLLDPNATDMDPRTEVLLYAAARAEHVAHVVRPALDAGTVVVCDRFVDSSLAYQGYARDQGHDDVAEISRWATDGLLPDVVVLLDLEPQEGLRRAADRVSRASLSGPRPLRTARDRRDDETDDEVAGPDRMESESLDFHRRVAQGYRALAERQRDRFIVVDAAADASTVARQVRAALHGWLPLPANEETTQPATDETKAEAATGSSRGGSEEAGRDVRRPGAAG